MEDGPLFLTSYVWVTTSPMSSSNSYLEGRGAEMLYWTWDGVESPVTRKSVSTRMGTARISMLSALSSSFSGLLDRAAMPNLNSEMGSSRPSVWGCRIMVVDTWAPALRGFPTSHCRVLLFRGEGGEQRMLTP